MAFDWLRSCYSTVARPYASSDNQVLIRWYFPSEATSFFPHNHQWGSLNWGKDQGAIGGEVIGQARPWRNGVDTQGLPGDHWCGEEEWFLSGIPDDAPLVVPEFCCQHPARGKLVLTGRLDAYYDEEPVANGGLELGGEVGVYLAEELAGEGALVLGGSSGASLDESPGIHGLLSVTGAVAPLPLTGPVGIGGQLVLTGSTAASLDTGPAGIGGQLVLSGSIQPALQEWIGENMTTIWADEGVVITGAALARALDALQRYSTYSYQNGNANGDTMEWGFYLPAGTYTLSILAGSSPVGGIVDLYLDGTLAVTGLQTYSAVLTYNVVSAWTVTVVGNGYHVLRSVVNGHHASSTGYQFFSTKFWLR